MVYSPLKMKIRLWQYFPPYNPLHLEVWKNISTNMSQQWCNNKCIHKIAQSLLNGATQLVDIEEEGRIIVSSHLISRDVFIAVVNQWLCISGWSFWVRHLLLASFGWALRSTRESVSMPHLLKSLALCFVLNRIGAGSTKSNPLWPEFEPRLSQLQAKYSTTEVLRCPH